MTDPDTLKALLVRPYLDRARHAALGVRFREAQQHLEQVRKIDPKNQEAALLTAKILLREGRLPECREALQEARRLGHPEHESESMVRWLEAHACDRASTSPAGVRPEPSTYERGAEAPPHAERLETTADLLFTIQKLRIYLTKHPDCATGLARMAEATARKSLHWGGSRAMLDEAETHGRRALAISPASSEAHASLGFIYGLRAAHFDAERNLRQAVELDEFNWFASHGLGLLLTHRGAYEMGARLLAKSIESQPMFIPNYDGLHQALIGLTALGHASHALDEGLERARARLDTIPDDLVARTQLAILQARKGLRSESRATTRDTAARFPKSGFAWAHCATAHVLNGDIQDAVSALRTARERNYDIRVVTGRTEFDPVRSSGDFAQLAAR
jgi:tetratricopeptide (TPR) repeat protein